VLPDTEFKEFELRRCTVPTAGSKFEPPIQSLRFWKDLYLKQKELNFVLQV